MLLLGYDFFTMKWDFFFNSNQWQNGVYDGYTN
jgi:hypothetical protein